MRQRTIAWVAAPALLVALAGCGGTSNAGYASDPPPPSYPASAPPTTGRTDSYGVPSTTKPTAPTQRVTAAAPPPASAPKADVPATPAFDGLKPGDTGPQVKALQDKLSSLGFWVGSSDGTYGLTTTQAVMAVQKAAGLERDGVMGAKTRQALASGVSVSPRSTSGRWIEINKSKQLAMIVDGGKVQEIFNSSTGSGETYTQDGQKNVANTPSGTFKIFRQVDRLDPGPLGDLWRPKYFNGGIALHGAADVPGYPASHGCARISNPAINWIWDTNQAPIGTSVWVY